MDGRKRRVSRSKLRAQTAPRVKRSKLTSKPSQLPASSAVKDEVGVIDDSMSAEDQEEEEEEVMTNRSCSPGEEGGEEGVADSNEGSVANDSDSNSDYHHQDYSDEEMDSDGEDEEERDGSHDEAEFTTAVVNDDTDASIAATSYCTTSAGDGISAKVKRVKIPGLYKPPTHDELQTLKETQNLFKSNLIRLQITELLSEIKPKKGTAATKQLEERLHSIKEFISSLPSSQKIDLCDGLSLLPKKLKYPLNLDISGTKGKFQFMAPSAVKVVGSYLLGAMVKSHLNVDITLSIPVKCLQAKDHLNYRYFHKRALYLAIVAGHLRKKRKQLSLKEVSFSFASGNPLLPIILLELEGKGISKYAIRIHTSIADPHYFKWSRFLPDRNNVRSTNSLCSESRHHQSDSENQSDRSALQGLPPTPHYNAALLSELGAMERHLKELYDVTQECPSVIDAIMLSKIWIQQRGLEKGYGGFTGFHLSMLISWLLRSKKINRLMSSYQILRIALQTISTGDWATHGISMAPAQEDEDQPSLDSFHSSFDIVFVDSSGYLNLCAGVSRERYQWLKHEASLALSFLDDPTINGFEALFMAPLPHLQKFDLLCHISPDSVFEPSSVVSDDATREAVLLDGAVWPLPLLLRKAVPILHRGLEKRVKLLTVLPENEAKWLPTKSPPSPSEGHVTLGLLLDTDHAFSIVNMGPPADSPEAAEFHSFWGEKSELRRFQDGSINEAVVWEEASQCGVAGRRLICYRIIQHLLNRHANISLDHVTCTAHQLDPLLSLPSYIPSSPSSSLAATTSSLCSTGEEINKKILDTFTELARDLRHLRDLPLSINSLQGTSPVFRYTEVFPSLPWNGHLSSKLRAKPTEDIQSDCYYPSCDIATPPYVPALEVVCQLESSGKWPEEVTAIDKVKTAFYVHMAKALKEKKAMVASPTEDYLDVLKDGYVFRLRIHYPRELSVLDEAAAASSSSSSAGTQADVARLKSRAAHLRTTLVSLPVHTSTLHGLHQQYPSYGPGARLCKRWVSAHLLTNHLSDEAVELMVAHLFVSPAPFTLPGSPLTVFLRFLSLLSSRDWASEPLIVNFNNELTSGEVAEMVTKFSSMRGSFPPVVLATPHDKLPSPWTTNSAPSQPVLLRLQLLARESLSLLTEKLSQSMHSTSLEDIKQVFRPPLDDYNVLIHLHKRHLPFAHLAVDTMETGSSHESHDHKGHHPTHLPVVDFNPVQQYLRELETAFSEFCLFFYDAYGGEFIAVVWKSQAFQPQSFRVMQAHCRILDKEGAVATSKKAKKLKKSLLVPDIVAILANFRLMGEGLVKKVEVLSPPPSFQ